MKVSIAAPLLSAILLLSTVSTTLGHARFDRADPAPGITLDAAPAELTIWFTDGLQVKDSWIRIFGPDGARVDLDDPRIWESNHQVMSVSLASDLAEGVYVVSWQSLSEDGHGLTGSFRFGVRAEVEG